MKHFMHVHLKYGIFSHNRRRNAASASIALPTNLPLLPMFNALILDLLDISSCHQQRLFFATARHDSVCVRTQYKSSANWTTQVQTCDFDGKLMK